MSEVAYAAGSPRRRRWRRVVLLLLVLLAAITMLAYSFVLPAYVHGRITQALHDAGYPNASFTLQSVTLSELVMTDLKLGPPATWSADGINVTYNLKSLWHGRALHAELKHAVGRVSVVDGRVYWGILSPASAPGPRPPLDLHLDQIAGDFSVTITVDGRPISLNATGRVQQLAQGLVMATIDLPTTSVDWSSLHLRADSIRVTAAADSSSTAGGGETLLIGDVRITGGQVRDDAGRIGASNLNIVLPVSSLPVAAPGTISADSVTVNGIACAGFNGTIQSSGMRLDAGIAWPVIAGGMLNATANFDLHTKRGEVTASMPEFELKDAKAIVPWLPQLAGTEMSGKFTLDAHAVYENGLLQPLIRIAAKDVAASKPGWSGSLESASGSVTIDSLSPLATSVSQELRIDRAKVGEMDITDGVIRFTLEEPNSLLIEDARWTITDMGEFRADALRLDPSHPLIDTAITAENVNLGRWLPLLSSDRVRGEGTLHGRLSLRVDPAAKNPIQIGLGELASMRTAGWIQTADTEMLTSMLEQSVQDDQTLNQVKQKIIAALQDFAYSSLDVEFENEETDVVGRITIRGKGRVGPEPQEIGGLTINIHNFNELLNQVLRLKPAAGRSE